MAKVTWKGSTLLSPVPAALITCGGRQHPNVFTVAWCGTICSEPPRVSISVRPERYSHDLIKDHGTFVINLTTDQLVRKTDYCGVRSGKNEDKLSTQHLAVQDASQIDEVLLKDSPMNLECKVFDVISLGSHDMFLADVVAVNVDESLIDEKGKLHLEQAGLIAYAHGDYLKLGKKIGSFGFSVRKKRPKNPKQK